MYAVIKTGGKQYRVKAGDLLVVEKLDGEPGAKIAFDQVLAIGEGEAVTLGEPMVSGAIVSATLVETRRGEKIKIFKKKRRQGYRRTRGHRQSESVLRVTAIDGGGLSDTWEGTVDFTPLLVLNERARNLSRRRTGDPVTPVGVDVETVVESEGKSGIVEAAVIEHADPAPTKAKAAPKKAAKAETAEAEAPVKKAKAPAAKAPSVKQTAIKSAAPKPTKAAAKTTVHKTAPRGKG